MTETRFLSRFATIANAVFNSTTANTTAVTAMSIGGHTINSTSLSAATNTFTVGTAAYFVSNGNVGIGTTTPSAKLNVVGNSSADAMRITQTGAGNALVVEDSANPDSTPLVVDTTGRLLVGYTTTIPGVFGFNRGFQLTNIGGTQSNYFQGDQFADAYTFTKTRGTPAAPHTIVSNGDDLGSVFFSGSDGTSFLAAAAIIARVDGIPGTNDMPGRLEFSTTADGANTVTERMRIDSSGSVRIGTTSTLGNSRLDVNTGITARTAAASGVTPYLQLFNGNAATDLKTWRLGATSAGALAFETVNDAYSAANQRMLIDASGRVIRPQQPAFTAYGGSGITTTGSSQTCVFTATALNVGSHYSTSTGRFTAPVTGLYHFTWFIAQSGGATGPVAYILVNGSSPGPTVISYGTAYNNACASVVLSLSANDFVNIAVIGFNSSFSFVDFGYSGFSGFLI